MQTFIRYFLIAFALGLLAMAFNASAVTLQTANDAGGHVVITDEACAQEMPAEATP